MNKYRNLEVCKKCDKLVEDWKPKYDAYKYICKAEIWHPKYRDDYITEPLPKDCRYKLEHTVMKQEYKR